MVWPTHSPVNRITDTSEKHYLPSYVYVVGKYDELTNVVTTEEIVTNVDQCNFLAKIHLKCDCHQVF